MTNHDSNSEGLSRSGRGGEQSRQRASAFDWSSLLVLILIAAGVWCFLWLASISVQDEPQAGSFDKTLFLALREADDAADPIGPIEVEMAVRDITALGSAAVLGLITIGAVLLLILRGNHRTAIILVLAVVGGTLLTAVVKDFYERPRPSLIEAALHLESFSFPSGHAMVSAVTYLTIGALLARTQRRTVIRVYVMSMAVSVTVAVGISRVYLGVHWPTDVMAGWLAGVLWASLVWLVANRLEPVTSP